MNDNYIRNREGKIIGRMDGNWLRDGTGKLLARYDKSDNRTRDRNGRIMGAGDQRLRALGNGDGSKRITELAVFGNVGVTLHH